MFLRHNLLGIVWAICIFVLCAMPADDFPNMSFWDLLNFDKVAHATVFAMLTLFLIVGFKKQYTFDWLRENAKKTAIIGSICYGGLLEVLQGTVFAARSMDVLDFIANTAGCFLGLLAFRMIYGKRLA